MTNQQQKFHWTDFIRFWLIAMFFELHVLIYEKITIKANIKIPAEKWREFDFPTRILLVQMENVRILSGKQKNIFS